MRYRGLVVHVLLPVVAGAAIYVLWRSPFLRVFQWLDTAGAATPVRSLRAAVMPARAWLPSWVLFSLPDGLWVYALTSWLTRIWRDAAGRGRWLWLSIGPVLGIGSELGQWAGLVPGTFDVVDLVGGVAAGGLALALGLRRGGTPSCETATSNR